MIKHAIKLVFLMILFLAGMFQQIRAAKIDIVILKNGDYITGEVKRMEFARLSYSTDAMKTLDIDWTQVLYLKANAQFRIELESGYDFSGSISTDSLNNRLIIQFDSLSFSAEFDEVVRIIPIKDTFLKRLKVNLDLGFSYTKASDIAQLTNNASASYRSWQWRHELTFNSIVTTKKDSSASKNIDLNWTSNRFFIYRWFVNGFIGGQTNTELGLRLRLLAGVGGGRDVFRTNTNLMTAALGLQVTQEWKDESQGGDTNLEGLIGLSHSKFQFDNPEISLNTSLRIYPNITTMGRIRFNFNTDLKWEVFKDFYWKLTFYDNFDNQPPSEGSSKNDYGITLSFGWKY